MSADARTHEMAERPLPSTARLRLLVFCGEITTHPLPRAGRVVLGRGADADVPIEHVTVSRKHAAILIGNDIQIVDEGSSNGTRVGGKRLVPHVTAPFGLATLAELGETMVVIQVAAEEEVIRSRKDLTDHVLRPQPAKAGAWGPLAHGSLSLSDTLGAFERERIREALAQCDGNRTRAAAHLGISRRTLVRRLDDLALPRPRR